MTPWEKQGVCFLIHLTLKINRNGIVIERRREGMVPCRRRADDERTGIERDVNTSPPQIDVELIGMARWMPEFGRPDKRKPRVRPQREVTTVSCLEFDSGKRNDLRLDSSFAEEPVELLIPRTGIEGPGSRRQVPRRLNSRPEILIPGIAQWKNERAVVCAVAGNPASNLVLQLVEKVSSSPDLFDQLPAERLVGDLSQSDRPDKRVEQRPVIVERVLGGRAVAINQLAAETFERQSADVSPASRCLQFREEHPDRPEGRSLADTAVRQST